MACDPCCGCCPLQQATKVIAIIQIIIWTIFAVFVLVVLLIIGGTIASDNKPKSSQSDATLTIILGVLLAVCIIGILFGVMLYCGAENRNSCKVLTWIVVTLILLILSALGIFIGDTTGIILSLLFLALELWLLTVVWAFYYEIS